MRSGYKRIGDYIRLVDQRNSDEKVTTLLGLSIDKTFIPSVANIICSDMTNYKFIRKGQFACSLMQVRRDKKIPVALLTEPAEGIISPAEVSRFFPPARRSPATSFILQRAYLKSIINSMA